MRSSVAILRTEFAQHEGRVKGIEARSRLVILQGVGQHLNWGFNEMLFMCWTRETSVIPAALAGLLLGMEAPGAEIIASVTFIAILMTILIQAPTTKWLAQRLGVLEEDKRARTIRAKKS